MKGKKQAFVPVESFMFNFNSTNTSNKGAKVAKEGSTFSTFKSTLKSPLKSPLSPSPPSIKSPLKQSLKSTADKNNLYSSIDLKGEMERTMKKLIALRITVEDEKEKNQKNYYPSATNKNNIQQMLKSNDLKEKSNLYKKPNTLTNSSGNFPKSSSPGFLSNKTESSFKLLPIIPQGLSLDNNILPKIGSKEKDMFDNSDIAGFISNSQSLKPATSKKFSLDTKAEGKARRGTIITEDDMSPVTKKASSQKNLVSIQEETKKNVDRVGPLRRQSDVAELIQRGFTRVPAEKKTSSSDVIEIELKRKPSGNKFKEYRSGNKVEDISDVDTFLGKKHVEEEKPKYKNKIKKTYSKSVPGVNYDGSTKINQDILISKEKVLGLENFAIFSVFDGHGQFGHYVSYFLKHNITSYFSNKDLYFNNETVEFTEADIYAKLKANNYKIIRKSYLNADTALKTAKIDSDLSGSTAVTAIIIDNKLICANAGDSRGIIVNEMRANSYTPTAISRDHKPELPEERERILRMGGAVYKISDGSDDIGPYRVWKKDEDYPGLAMSRSLGDFIGKSVGVSAEADILEFDITSETRFVVLASDGIWEFLSNKQVCEIVHRAKDIQKAADILIEEATRYWKLEDVIVDDITVIIIAF